MFNNGSPYWRNAHATRGSQSTPNAELLAALEQTDISEPMRAAITRALDNNRVGDTDPTDPAVKGTPTEPVPGPHVGPPKPVNDPRDRYTLHLTFPAGSLNTARAKAIAYAKGLATLRPETSVSTPLLSRTDDWNHIEPLFCGDTGPANSICVAPPGHPGPHRSSGTCGQ